MAELYKKYSEQGFHIIGLECQNSATDAITGIASGSCVKFQLGTGGSIMGADVSGIPHGFLFGADGKLVADNPNTRELESKVKQLVKETGAALAGPGPYVKLAALAAQIKSGLQLGSVLKTLETKKASKAADEAAEATMMYDALSGGAQEQIQSALAQKDQNAASAVSRLDKLAMQFSGHELGTKARQESDTLKKDPAVKKEIDAEAMWKQIDTMNDSLKPVRGVKNPKDEAFRKTNGAGIQAIVGGCQALAQRFPGTAAAKKADELMNTYR